MSSMLMTCKISLILISNASRSRSEMVILNMPTMHQDGKMRCSTRSCGTQAQPGRTSAQDERAHVWQRKRDRSLREAVCGQDELTWSIGGRSGCISKSVSASVCMPTLNAPRQIPTFCERFGSRSEVFTGCACAASCVGEGRVSMGSTRLQADV